MNKIFILVLLAGCSIKKQNGDTGEIERLDPALDQVISAGAKPTVIAQGFEWSEGPVWVEGLDMLLFSDVPRDTVYKWTQARGTEVYLTPSGYTDTVVRGGEMGSNGLLLDKNGKLVLCQHGNRQLARMEAPLDKPSPAYTPLAWSYDGKKFNSPNDAVYNSRGELFFTDPPYGLEQQMKDPKKEIPFQGVYKLDTTGRVHLLVDSFTRPNGIAFLPGEKTMLVANSDREKPYWYAVHLGDSDSVTSVSIFHSAAGGAPGEKGLPDGLKVTRNGIVFASGPGGVWIMDSKGKLLGKIKLKAACSNVALTTDEKTLYITNDMQVLRLILRN